MNYLRFWTSKYELIHNFYNPVQMKLKGTWGGNNVPATAVYWVPDIRSHLIFPAAPREVHIIPTLQMKKVSSESK